MHALSFQSWLADLWHSVGPILPLYLLGGAFALHRAARFLWRAGVGWRQRRIVARVPDGGEPDEAQPEDSGGVPVEVRVEGAGTRAVREMGDDLRRRLAEIEGVVRAAKGGGEDDGHLVTLLSSLAQIPAELQTIAIDHEAKLKAHADASRELAASWTGAMYSLGARVRAAIEAYHEATGGAKRSKWDPLSGAPQVPPGVA